MQAKTKSGSFLTKRCGPVGPALDSPARVVVRTTSPLIYVEQPKIKQVGNLRVNKSFEGEQ